MAFYLVKGCDRIYGGLHGMRGFDIGECREEADAIDWALDLAADVVASYSEIYDSLEEDVREECEAEGIDYESNGSKVDEIREEIYSEDYEIEVGLLDENELPTFDLDELSDLYWNDPDEFEKLYVLRWIS